MKKFIVFGLSLILIVSSVVIMTTSGKIGAETDSGVALTSDEVVETRDFGNELTAFSAVMPDISPVFTGESLSGYTRQTLSEKTDGKIKSVTVECSADGTIDIKGNIASGGSETEMDYKTRLIFDCVVTMDEKSILLDYTRCETIMTGNIGGVSAVAEMSFPFKIYFDETTLGLRYGQISYTVNGYNFSSEISSVLSGRWLYLDGSTDFGEYGDVCLQMFNWATKGFSGELNYYSDYLSEYAEENFLNRNGTFYLKKSCAKDFWKGLFVKNRAIDDEYGIWSNPNDIKVKVLSGEFSIKLGETEKIIKAVSDYVSTIKENLGGTSMNIVGDCSMNYEYKITKENSTTVERPDFGE